MHFLQFRVNLVTPIQGILNLTMKLFFTSEGRELSGFRCYLFFPPNLASYLKNDKVCILFKGWKLPKKIVMGICLFWGNKFSVTLTILSYAWRVMWSRSACHTTVGFNLISPLPKKLQSKNLKIHQFLEKSFQTPRLQSAILGSRPVNLLSWAHLPKNSNIFLCPLITGINSKCSENLALSCDARRIKWTWRISIHKY